MGAIPSLNAGTMTADSRSAVTMPIPTALSVSFGVRECIFTLSLPRLRLRNPPAPGSPHSATLISFSLNRGRLRVKIHSLTPCDGAVGSTSTLSGDNQANRRTGHSGSTKRMQHVCGICRGYPGEVNDRRGPAGKPEIRLPTLFGKLRASELHP